MNKQIIVTALLSLAIGAGVSYIAPWGASQQPQQGTIQKADSKERKPLYYRNPMNPTVTSPLPAKDSMGMDYIPVYADDGGGDDGPTGMVRIDPVVAQSIGVRSILAKRKTITHNIRAVGLVALDEERVARLHPKVEGWVEKLYVDITGEPVKKDTVLLALYSPELVSSQDEYLLAVKNVENLNKNTHPDIREGAISLLNSSLERLQLFDVPAHQIAELESKQKLIKNMHIHSPFDGIVFNIGVREGQYVTPATELYKIADLSSIWVYVDIYEDEMPWVRTGDKAEMKVTGIPGKTFRGKVNYVYPYLDPKTRTNKVRLEFSNPGLELKPDMFANVTLLASQRVDAIIVPIEAIIRTGKRDQIFIMKGEGKFEPREVTLGFSTNGDIQIIEGVKAGEEVVTSAQFLIDSESKLNEATAKMMEANKPRNKQADPDMDMEGMDIKDMQKEGDK